MEQLRKTRSELQQQLRASEIARLSASSAPASQRNDFITPNPTRNLSLTPIAPASFSPSAPPSPAPSPSLTAPSPSLPAAPPKATKPKVGPKVQASGTNMVAAASHQISKENEARDAARAKAEAYKVSSMVRSAYQTLCSALSPAASKAKELAQSADSRTLLIACYVLSLPVASVHHSYRAASLLGRHEQAQLLHRSLHR